ncbi:MAG: MBL fold metallo-hydrolase, partial [Prochloraceae cyanobacterium]
LILLSQGLEDHAHPPTLKQLDRNIPVVASPTAAKVVTELGYVTVTALEHQEKFTLKDTVEIKAVPGSPIGPQLVENGYIVKNLATGHSLYYEPHGYHSESLKEDAPIDVVITPIITLKLFQFLPFIKGQKNALEACQLLQPQVILPTAAGGDVKFDGLLTSILSADGSIADFQTLLNKNNLSTEVIDPQPGDRLAIELKERAVSVS